MMAGEGTEREHTPRPRPAPEAVALVRGAVERALQGPGAPPAGGRLVVALSGGLDSMALLHALRFGAGPHDVMAAHFDHRLRPESGDDAAWVRGVCAAWGVPLAEDVADAPPTSEAEARALRYAFLHRVRRGWGAAALLTAHHADDQAETVLFRVLRGTGLRGLAGIPADRDGTILRPLLCVWREELDAYAAAVGLRWRRDATNDALHLARNAIRHRLLPDAERLVAPGARRALVRLAGLAAADEQAWDEVVDTTLEALGLRDEPEEGGACSVDRDALAGLAPALGARVVRRLAGRLGHAPDAERTRAAQDFVASGRSGAHVELGGGVRLARRLDRLVVSRGAASAAAPDAALEIAAPGPGEGVAVVGGRALRVRWGPGDRWDRAGGIRVPIGRLPLLVRARRPGDRIRLPGGTTKVNKLLLEARIGADVRDRIPIVADGTGAVLWIPGVAVSRELAEAPGDTVAVEVES